MRKKTGKDIWDAKNQPYGYWRAGNPIVKAATLISIIVGAFAQDPSLIVQGTIVVFIMLWAPFNPFSTFRTYVVNLGIGCFLVASFGPSVVQYETLRFTTDIPNIAKIDWLSVITVFIMFVAFFNISRAITSRDFAWLIDLTPNFLRAHIAGIMYSFAYGFLRAPTVLWSADVAIRSRGGHRLISLRAWRSSKTFIDTLSIWSLYLLREMKEMAITVDYVVVSRVVLNRRKTPIARKWSSTDISIAGVLLFAVVIPRIAPLVIDFLKGLLSA